MRAPLLVLALGTALAGSAAWADPPKPLHVSESVEVKASLDKVWDTVKNFDGLDKWHPGIASDELVSGKNNEPGAVRKLTVKGGPVVVEKLLTFDDAHHSYRYRIVESPLPVAHYTGTVSVRAGKGGMTKVTWSGSFKRKNTSDNPPESENDEAAVKLIKGVYRGGLDNLKKMFEG
ncbi:MAG TPA: SRPBCC family protein [Steroidobacteraceae bacterium]|jgi:mxaD protein|nr:SRPBCC family protein [Steroidobacteraceae bacterium]